MRSSGEVLLQDAMAKAGPFDKQGSSTLACGNKLSVAFKIGLVQLQWLRSVVDLPWATAVW